MSVRINRSAIMQIMGSKRMTGRALAEKMNLAPQALSAMLTRGTCSHINAAKMADALECAMDELLKEDST